MISRHPEASGSMVCHCCGRDCIQAGSLHRVYGGGGTGVEPVWSCYKHLGRLPCIIEGCGRTYRLEADESYATRVVCGRHWRMSPRYMRDAVRRVSRIAAKRGWDDTLYERHSRLWDRCIRAVHQALDDPLRPEAIQRWLEEQL
jgi:hypothetical protein